MAESERSQQLAAAPSSDRPAVGIVAGRDEANAVAGAILRAKDQGHQAVVFADLDADVEGLDFARKLGAIVVEPDRTVGVDPERQLVRAARTAGFPGVILQEDVETILDYERSWQELRSSVAYTVVAEPISRIEDGSHNSDEGQHSTETHIDRSETRLSTDKSVLGIVPAFNEESELSEVITDTKRYVDDVIVIDDASSDETAAVAGEVADGVITHPKNMGVGGSVHTGYLAGIRDGYDIIVQIDADGQHDPSYIPELIRTLEEKEADMVIGSRWLNGSFKDYSWIRRAGIRFFTFEANVLGGLDITDVTSGYRAYRVEMLENLGRPENGHWALEQTLEAARKGYSIEEVSIPMPPAPNGSQFDLSTFLKYPPRMLLITLKVILFR